MNASVNNQSSTMGQSLYAPERAPFFVAAFGTSTPFAYWGFELLCNLVAHLTGDYYHIHGVSLGELRDQWKERGNKSVVFTTDFPESALRTFLLANQVQAIAFLDTPKDAIISAVGGRDYPIDEACRFATWTFAASADVLCDQRTLLIQRWRHKSVRSIVAEILAYLNRHDTVEEGAIDLAMAHLFPEASVDEAVLLEPHLVEQNIHGALLGDQTVDLTAEDERMAEMIASSYQPLFDGRPPKEIRWPPEVFFTGDRQPILGPIELTGGARAIIWGPYMCLPPGAWEACVTFEVVDNFLKEPMIVDVWAGATLLEKKVNIPERGIFSYRIQFEITDPNHAVEVRLLMMKGAIEGHFKLRSAVFTAIDHVAEKIVAPALIDSRDG